MSANDAVTDIESVMIVDEDHYVPVVFYGAGTHTLTKASVGTRYFAAVVRTLVDPEDPKDVQQVHALHDKLTASQKSTGKFEVPNWDQASQKKVRDALLVLNTTISDFKNGFGARGKVDPIMHLIGTASGWGGNPDKDATYVMVTPAKNDSTTVYKLNVKNVPVDGFWSVSVWVPPRQPARSRLPWLGRVFRAGLSLCSGLAGYRAGHIAGYRGTDVTLPCFRADIA